MSFTNDIHQAWVLPLVGTFQVVLPLAIFITVNGDNRKPSFVTMTYVCQCLVNVTSC